MKLSVIIVITLFTGFWAPYLKADLKGISVEGIALRGTFGEAIAAFAGDEDDKERYDQYFEFICLNELNKHYACFCSSLLLNPSKSISVTDPITGAVISPAVNLL